MAGILAAELSSRRRPRFWISACQPWLVWHHLWAQRLPKAHIYALDWANVLEVGQRNAGKQGLADRYHLLPAAPLTWITASGFDAILITKPAASLDPLENEKMLKKA